MCKHADNTKEIIDHLIKDVYPLLNQEIDKAAHCTNLELSNVPEKEMVKDLLIHLKNEFHSLATYEEKLVFPSVLKVFNAKKEQTVLPNLVDLLRLTRSKEHKINDYVKKINILISNHLWETELQDHLVEMFSNNFFKEKAVWNNMIEDRVASCGCFKKNYFEMARLYEHNSLSSIRNNPKKTH